MGRSTASRLLGPLFALLAAFLVLAFLFALYADSVDLGGISLTADQKLFGLIGTIALGALVLLVLVLLLIRGRIDPKSDRAAEAEVFFIPEHPAPPAAATTTFDTAPDVHVYDLSRVPVAHRSWSAPEVDGKQHPFYFPRNVADGVYVNDYVPIDGKWKLLKLRTLLGGPFEAAYVEGGQRRQMHTYQPVQAATTSRAAMATVVHEPAHGAGDAWAPAANVGRSGTSELLLQEVAAETLPAAPVTEEFYFDFPGHNHEVEDLEGIGPTYGQRLRSAGVHTTARLAYEDVGKLAEAIQVPRGTVEAWKQMSELVKVKGIGPQYAEALVRSGITSIADLKRRSPARMAQQINAYLATLDVNVIGNKITEKRVDGWKEAAKPMKRIKLQVPAQ